MKPCARTRLPTKVPSRRGEKAKGAGKAGMAGEAVGGEVRRDGGIALARRGPPANGIFLPAQPILDDVARREAGMIRLHDLAYRAAGHDLVQADRRRIG